jgi:ABC-2 type transport system ATP-binding protein
MSDVMIEVDGLTKDYGLTRAVDHVSFSVRQGEVLGFLGPNGAGKSTTMKMLTCFLSPTAVRAKVAGRDVFDESLEVRRRIGYLPEDTPIYRDMTVLEFLQFAAAMRGMDPARSAERIKEVGTRCGLSDVAGKEVGELSKGFRQRVGLAQAMLHDPDILILDEPTSGLDPVQIVEMRATIKVLRGEHTILLSSHILSEISQTCDRLLVIQNGEIVAQGSEQDLATQLGGGGTIEIEVVGAAARAIEVARTVTGIGEGSIIREGDGVALVSLQGPPDLRPKVARALVGNGIDLLRIDKGAARLESIFLKLTKGPEATPQ